VDRDRWFEMAETLSAVTTDPGSAVTLCSGCRDLLLVSGASISLAAKNVLAPLCGTDSTITALDDMQFTLGEGPTLDAFSQGQPVMEAHLDAELPTRWPVLAETGVGPDVGSVFAFPLGVGAARVGVLTLYQRRASALSRAQHADALIAADVLAHVILSRQGRAPGESLAAEFKEAGSSRAEIHQASGMLSEQIHMSVADALVQLRSHAYATGRPVTTLALAVIARQLRLLRTTDGSIEWDENPRDERQ
jgi:hypothetical protein